MQHIETERLLMRELSLDDLSALHRIFSDPTTMQFWPAPFTIDATRSWIERNLESYAILGFGRWAVTVKQTGELIGDCGIIKAEIDSIPEYDLGYIIHHPYWGQGYATEAASACTRYAFETLGIKRLVANMAADHQASARVAEKIDMRREKTFHNPRNRNLLTHVYALTSTSASTH